MWTPNSISSLGVNVVITGPSSRPGPGAGAWPSHLAARRGGIRHPLRGSAGYSLGNIVADLGGGSRRPRALPLHQVVRGGLLDPYRLGGKAEVLTQHRRRQDRGGRVSLLLARDVGGAAVHRLEHAGRGPLRVDVAAAASPMPPATAAPRSVRMSPKRLSVTITSNRSGSVTRNIVAASTWQ